MLMCPPHYRHRNADMPLYYRYRKVLKYLVTQLSDPANFPTLQHWHSDLLSALRQSSFYLDWNDCIELLINCGNTMEVEELVEVIIRKGGTCGVNTNARFKIATGLLRFNQPETLAVCVPSTPHLLQQQDLRDLLRSLQRHFSGKLILSLPTEFKNYIPCDDLLLELNNARYVACFIGI